MTIITEYPLWLIIFCLLLGGVYAAILYYKNREIDFGKNYRIALIILRWSAISLVSFLLLGPLTKLTVKGSEKPVIVIGVDNSESVILSKDSAFYKTELITQLKKLEDQLDGKYEVVPYLIGNQSRRGSFDELDYQDKATNISDFFDQIELLYTHRNLGAVLLVSDGIYNRGSNPYYQTQKIKSPIYTVGLGNPEAEPDLFIAQIIHNRQTFKGNHFPVEIKLAANKLKGQKFSLTISENGKELVRENFSINSNQYYETFRTTLETKEKGIKRYQVEVTPLEGELTHKNNKSNLYIEVVDQKEKIAIAYNAPHPDVAAIKSALDVVEKYETEVYSIDEFKKDITPYSLVILHQLPSVRKPIQDLTQELQKQKRSVLYILGPKSDYARINNLQTGVTINQNKKLTNEAAVLHNDNFILFSYSEELKQFLQRVPPLITPFGEYKTAVSASTFLYQKIAGVETPYPLILFNENVGVKNGVIVGSGIADWKRYNYLYEQNHEAFNELIQKMVLFLSVKGDRDFFRVEAKSGYDESEPIQFYADLYNEAYELQNEADVELIIESEDGKKFSYQFSKQNRNYSLSVGHFPPGEYRWHAQAQWGSKNYQKSGHFTVKETMLESQNLVADHALLQGIADNSKGQMISKEQLSEFEKLIKKDDQIKTIATYSRKFSLLLNSTIYFVILILLFSAEWFIRKWRGSY